MTSKSLYELTGEAVLPSPPKVSPPVSTVPPLFTLSKKTHCGEFLLDNTKLSPSAAVCLQPNKHFADSYTRQLEGLLFNTQEQLDPEVLQLITALSDMREGAARPIRLMSQAHVKRLPILYRCLNDFFSAHRKVIRGISEQLNG